MIDRWLPEVDDEVVGVSLVVVDVQQASQSTTSAHFVQHLHELRYTVTGHTLTTVSVVSHNK